MNRLPKFKRINIDVDEEIWLKLKWMSVQESKISYRETGLKTPITKLVVKILKEYTKNLKIKKT